MPAEICSNSECFPHRYFAYGSNLCPDQMAARCPGALVDGVGELLDHRLVFNRRGTYRPGGVASVVPSGAGDGVHGVVWRLTDGHLAALDEIEHPDAYERIDIDVRTGAGLVRCVTYVSFPQADHVAPDEAYIGVILRGARAHGLPEAYIESIEAMSVR